MPHPAREPKKQKPCDRLAKECWAGNEPDEGDLPERSTVGANGRRLLTRSVPVQYRQQQVVSKYSARGGKINNMQIGVQGEHERHRSVQKGDPGLYQGWDQQRLTRDRIWNVLCQLDQIF